MNVNGKEINLTPTEGMREEAQRYRDWKAEGEAGGTEVAARRATQILSGDELSVDTVREMNAWFARHEVDKQGEGFTPDEDGYPSKGRVAWAAWGGDPGQSWSKMKAEAITDAQDRSLRAGPDDLKVGDFVRWDSSGGTARGRITRIAREGSIDVPDSSFTINADENDPAALIRVYREGDDGFEETDRLVGHRFSTLTKIDSLRSFAGEILKRAHAVDFYEDEEDDRTLEFPFASEEPVERYFGMEVLNMSDDAMDMSRLNDGAPLLYQHDADRIVGVVERAYIKDKRAYAKVKMANNELGREMQELIKDGIIRNVSFGYKINAMDEDRSTDPVTYRATSYQPFEVSLVTVPADNSVGIGRSFQHNGDVETASAVQT
ncbi:MAG: phage major capsid protein, partial [Marivivens sp.]|nr:phage major capsid protein [Marivivens sp.]